MQPGSRYPRIYEADRKGPAITREDFIKTAASLRAVLQMVQLSVSESDMDGEAEFKRLGRMLSAEIGRQWSLLTALQYLTGQRADKAVQRWMPAFLSAGFTPEMIQALIATANDFCANGVAGKTLSAGLLVQDYKKQPIGPEVMLELLQLPRDVIDRVKANAALSGR